MPYFKRDNKFGGGKGGKKFGGRNFGDEKPMMHRAVCDECAQECEVPFKPSGEKPVFCRACFKKKGGGGRDSVERSFGNKPAREEYDKTTKQFEILNAKLDKILEALGSKES